jgi:hypothetical protein
MVKDAPELIASFVEAPRQLLGEPAISKDWASAGAMKEIQSPGTKFKFFPSQIQIQPNRGLVQQNLAKFPHGKSLDFLGKYPVDVPSSKC